MPLPTPNLDDRTFQELLDQARERVAELCPQWTDLLPSDPGVTLLELFAYLTDVMLYRLNRVPDKAYIEFLRLMGVTVLPPSAAAVELHFTLAEGTSREVTIPRGTRVTTGRGGTEEEPPVFVTARTVLLDPAQPETDVIAHQCEQVEGELAGVGTGRPGHWVTARRPPIVAPTGDELDLVVGVEMESDRIDDRVPCIRYAGKTYRIWREVESFAEQMSDPFVYVADRTAGLVTFAPAVRRQDDGGLEPVPQALAAVPPAGREVRLWYRRGGGPAGNVAAGLLTTLKDPVPGVQVTNPAAATGGRAGESLDNALVRGPQELHSLKRAVTARDFELVAQQAGGVTRAKAFTQAALWRHAPPGSVEVLLVPELPESDGDAGAVTLPRLQEHQTEPIRRRVQAAIDERRPLGTACRVSWARCKPVGVGARVVVHAEEDPAGVESRVLNRLNRLLNPLAGRAFGWPLRASHVYDAILSEPGVRYAEAVSFQVGEAPAEGVEVIAADAAQPRTWYAGAGPTLFRSMDDGDGWEAVGRFEGERVRAIQPSPDTPGLLAAATQREDGAEACIHISEDCGETWRRPPIPAALIVHDLAWIIRDRTPVLLLATNKGLYQLPMQPRDARLVQVLVDPKDQDRGFYSVAVSPRVRGGVDVAVAAQRTGGVFLSVEGGLNETFTPIGLIGEDVRVLRVQRVGPRAFLWVGLAAAGGAPGKGCFRWELRETAQTPEGWQPVDRQWQGGSCRGLAFADSQVMAATYQAGVLLLDSAEKEPAWRSPRIDAGLPLRDADRLHYRIEAVAARVAESDEADKKNPPLLIVGTPMGVYRSRDGGQTYANCSALTFADKVTIPPTWLFCSGQHQINVDSEDEQI